MDGVQVWVHTPSFIQSNRKHIQLHPSWCSAADETDGVQVLALHPHSYKLTQSANSCTHHDVLQWTRRMVHVLGWSVWAQQAWCMMMRRMSGKIIQMMRTSLKRERAKVCVCVCVCVYGAWTGMARAIYVRCTFGIFGREITEYTVYTYGSGQPFRVWCMMYLYFISTCNIMLSYQIRHAWYNAIMQYYIRGTFWMKVLVHAASGQGVSDECMLQVARS